jgi:SAM-dependent methyltransferase
MSRRICPICNSTNPKKKIEYQDWGIYRCSKCGFRFADGGKPIVLDDHYDKKYFEPLILRDETDKWSKIYNERLTYAKQWAPSPKLLEVGAGASIFARVAADSGFEVDVVDGSPAAIELLTAYDGVSGWVADLNKCELPESTYGVVHSSHVIEHLSDPINFLQNCVRTLTNEGLLLLSFPLYEGWLLAIRDGLYRMGVANHPYNYQAPDHLSYFDASCIRMALEQVGFEVVSLRRTKFISLNYSLSRMLQNSMSRRILSRVSNTLSFLTDKIGFYRDVEIVAKRPK